MIEHFRKNIPLQMGNIAGSFADGAILFPLLAALAIHTDLQGAILIASTGFAYIGAGIFFRVPMPVQPLKSIVAGALALGASGDEIRIAGLGVGLFCLLLATLPVDKIEKHVPRHLVQGIQFSLGILLLSKGVEWTWGAGSSTALAAAVLFVPAAIFLQSRMTVPVLGIIAVLGMLFGVWTGGEAGVLHTDSVVQKTGVRSDIIMALLLPQLALTLTNSVIGTYDTAHRYFGVKALHVTLKNLLLSIGLGNVVMALIGGLPFCHGSGGLTAHVKAGAKNYAMNFYIGFFLVTLAAISIVLKMDLIPHYPVLLMAALVSITGWYHMRLAADSWIVPDLRLIIIVMGVVALISQNILYSLLMGIGCEVVRHISKKYRHGNT